MGGWIVQTDGHDGLYVRKLYDNHKVLGITAKKKKKEGKISMELTVSGRPILIIAT